MNLLTRKPWIRPYSLHPDKGLCTGKLHLEAMPIKLHLCRYDVEQYQKIEALIGQRMEKFEHEEEAALLLYERVTEAQKLATMQVCTS